MTAELEAGKVSLMCLWGVDMLDGAGEEMQFDDCDILDAVDDDDGVIAIHFNDNAKRCGYITLTDEEIEIMFISIKSR